MTHCIRVWTQEVGSSNSSGAVAIGLTLEADPILLSHGLYQAITVGNVTKVHRGNHAHTHMHAHTTPYARSHPPPPSLPASIPSLPLPALPLQLSLGCTQVRMWLALGLDANMADVDDPDDRETPLMRAAAYDRPEVVCVRA